MIVCDRRYFEKPIDIVCWACMSSIQCGKVLCWPWSMIAYLTIQRFKCQIEKLCFSSTFSWRGNLVYRPIIYTANITDLYTIYKDECEISGEQRVITRRVQRKVCLEVYNKLFLQLTYRGRSHRDRSIQVYPSNICQGDGLCRPNHPPLL